MTDKSVSRSHATISCSGGSLKLFDMGSSRGTKLDGVKLGGTRVSSGDVVRVGRTELTFAAATT